MQLNKTWEEFKKDVFKLIENIGNYKPDVIVPLLRGGSGPQLYLAEGLDIYDVRPINVERRGDKRRIVYPPEGNIGNVSDHDILLLEDDVPTGGSLLYAKSFYEAKGARVKIAAVYVHSKTVSLVNFYGQKLDPLPNLPWKPSRSGDRVVK